MHLKIVSIDFTLNVLTKTNKQTNKQTKRQEEISVGDVHAYDLDFCDSFRGICIVPHSLHYTH